ncbi:MAG: pilus assembly protein CpaB [Frankiaceae bacterium]|jgi:Flp pilus assembly protein CpaB|nr:pilus assembly protein CpaB [Frankiaceae bacterium]
MDPRLTAARRAVRRRLLWHRRPIAATFAGLAVLTGFGAYRDLRTGVPVVVATRDLPAGRLLSASDLSVVSLPPGSAADGAASAVESVVGQRLALPMRRHEAVTDVRLIDAGLLARLGAGLRAVPVRFADPAAAEVVQPGSVVDVYARSDADTPIGAVVIGATVLQVLTSGDQGVVLLLAADDNGAAKLAGAAGAGALSVAVRAPP